MKKTFHIFLFMVSMFAAVSVEGHKRFTESPVYEEDYSWDATDSTQKKQAVGMTFTGVIFFVVIAIVAGLYPSEADSTTVPLTQSETGNTILD
jgi:hypothetical protein